VLRGQLQRPRNFGWGQEPWVTFVAIAKIIRFTTKIGASRATTRRATDSNNLSTMSTHIRSKYYECLVPLYWGPPLLTWIRRISYVCCRHYGGLGAVESFDLEQVLPGQPRFIGFFLIHMEGFNRYSFRCKTARFINLRRPTFIGAIFAAVVQPPPPPLLSPPSLGL
jgi:hypothetical protein